MALGLREGGAISGLREYSEDTATATTGDGTQMRIIRCGNRLDPGTAAYAVFPSGAPPRSIAFAVSDTPNGIPEEWEPIWPAPN